MPDQVYWDEVGVGAEIPPLRKNCSTRQLVMWAGAAEDFHPIHYDQAFAKDAGLGGIIVHGGLKNAFLGQLLHDWVAPHGFVKSFGCTYRGMDYPDQDILCRGIVTRKYVDGSTHLVDLEIWTENPSGQKTSPGTGTVVLPAHR